MLLKSLEKISKVVNEVISCLDFPPVNSTRISL